MKKRLRRWGAALLILALLAAQMPVSASAVTGEESAQKLYELKLFKGVGALPDGSPDFALNRTPTRGEGITMLVRLLGAEGLAQVARYEHPFKDVASWADPYVGYAYARGISEGISESAFGTDDPISRDQFLTLLLRSMRYDRVDWRNPAPVADKIGLNYPAGRSFCRGDVADICWSAMRCKVNGSPLTLYEQLLEQGTVSKPIEPESSVEFTAETVDEVIPGVVEKAAQHFRNIVIHVPVGREAEFGEYVAKCIDYMPDVERWSWQIDSDYGLITVSLEFNEVVRILEHLDGKQTELKENDTRTMAAAQTVISNRITSDMSEYDKAKVLHAYLVNTTLYADDGDVSATAAGALLEGRAICDGYSRAYQLLCRMAGLECIKVNGYGKTGRHAWNKVKIDGNWYNVDTTWDDPISSRPILRHDYFLISDQKMARDHSWQDFDSLPDSPGDWQS